MFTSSTQRIPVNDTHGEILFAAVREGLAPFKPWSIHMWADFDKDRNEFLIAIDVTLYTGYRLIRSIRSDSVKQIGDLDGEVRRLGAEIVERFRFRSCLDIPSNIVLGCE